MLMPRPSLLLLLAALAGCGRVADLEPPPGKSLPVKPLMARSTATAEELLTPPSYADPERVDELIKRSQPRPVDRFDLPPAGGGSAPAPVVGLGEQDPTNETGPADPE